MDRRIYALIPAYEPDERLAELCCALKAANCTTVVVDDGSGEGYAALFDGLDVAIVLTHVDNMGKGAALKIGLRYIAELGQPGDIVVTADADGQHTPADILRVAAEAQGAPDALVLGCRGFGEQTPLRSRIGNSAARWVFRMLTGVAVHDTQTGLRAFSLELLPFLLSVNGTRYEYEMNVLLDCAKGGVPIREVPIETIYIDNNSGSHFHALRDAWRIFREVLCFAASSLAGFVIDYAFFALFSQLTAATGSAALPLANVLARIVSASANFAINRRFVFRSCGSAGRAALRYALLAAAILAANTGLLILLVDHMGVNRYAAKLGVESALFVASFIVQRLYVFRRS